MLSAIPYIGTDLVYFVWGGFSVQLAPFGDDIDLQILLFAGKSSIGIEYETLIVQNIVKKSRTRGQSAGVRILSTYVHALQRLNAGDLFFPYFVGLIEGCGYFSISKNGLYIQFEFGMEFSLKDLPFFYKIKDQLQIGIIRYNRNTVSFKVINKSSLINVIFPIFDKYPFLSNKQYDYLRFKEILLSDIKLYDQIPTYIKPSQFFNSINFILEVPYFSPWLIGFIEAEGCFSIYQPNNDYSFVASFDIGQKNELNLLLAIQKFFSFFVNITDLGDHNYKLKVSSVRYISNLIQFLDKTSVKFLGYKKLQYILWLKKLRQIPRYSQKINIPQNY